jgi:hypothetical protein
MWIRGFIRGKVGVKSRGENFVFVLVVNRTQFSGTGRSFLCLNLDKDTRNVDELIIHVFDDFMKNVVSKDIHTYRISQLIAHCRLPYVYTLHFFPQ